LSTPGTGTPREAPAGLERLDEVYSHSRLSSFETCPQKFQYRYVWKLPAESESIEGFVGKRVHEVLERLHRSADGGRLPTLPKVLWRYGQLFDEAYDPTHVRIVREGTPLGFYRELGEHCIANYYHDHYPFDADETLALEERVTLDLDGSGRYRLQGFVDRIARARDGAIEIQDYKTGARVPSQAQADADRQLALYQMAFHESGLGARYGERPVRLVWHYLRKGKTLVSTRSPQQLGALRDETRTLIDRIREERVFKPKPSALCGWCEYRKGCPANPERKPDQLPYARPTGAAARAPLRRPKTPPTGDPGQLAFIFGASS
jgi:putative RecB family exonuclease